MTNTHNRPHLSRMIDADLDYYAEFVDWHIVRCPEKDLIYWADERAAILTERLGRQAIQALKQVPHNITRT